MEGMRLTDEQLRHVTSQIYDQTSEAVFIIAIDDLSIVDANPSALTMLGFSKSELLQMSALDLYVSDDHEQIRNALGVLKEQGSLKKRITLHQRKKDGTVIPVTCNCIFTSINSHGFAECIISDVSDQVETERKLNEHKQVIDTLTSIIDKISSNQDIDTILLSIIEHAVLAVDGDAGGICLYDEEGHFLTAPVLYKFPPGLLDALLAQGTTDPVAKIVMRQKKPLVDLDYVNSEYRLQELIDVGVKSIARIPILARDQALGMLGICSIGVQRDFKSDEIELLSSIAKYAGIALENAMLYEEQRKALEEEKHRTIILQKSFLPSVIPTILDIDVAAFYESATEATLIGGDFYDVIPFCQGQAAFVVGDVSGKGIEAAATTSMVRNVLRSFAYQNPEPAYVLDNANNIIIKQIDMGMFITLIYMLYDENRQQISYVNAGHPYMISCACEVGVCCELTANDPACCLIDDYKYTSHSLRFTTGDVIVMHTDGLTEARNGDHFFGIERTRAVIQNRRTASATDIADGLVQTCRDFANNKLTDDVAVLVLKKH